MDLSCLHTHTAPLIFILFLDKKREGKKPSITLSNVFIPMGTTTTPLPLQAARQRNGVSMSYRDGLDLTKHKRQ
jgi:hypothetical protein